MKVITLIDSNTKELVNFEEIAEIPSGFEPDGVLFAIKDGKNYKRVVDGTFKVSWLKNYERLSYYINSGLFSKILFDVEEIMLKSTLSINSNNLIIDFRNCKITSESDVFLKVEFLKNVVIENLNYDGRWDYESSPNLNKIGILVDSSSDVIVKNSILSNIAGYGIKVEKSNNVEVTSCYITKIGYSAIMILSSHYGKITYNVISSIKGINNRAYGIALTRIVKENETSDEVDNVSDYVVTDNNISDVLSWEGIDTHGGNRLRISGNEIQNCRVGIAIVPTHYNNVKRDASKDVIVEGNVIKNCTANAINLSGSNESILSENCYISSNIIDNCGEVDNNINAVIKLQFTKGAIVINNVVENSKEFALMSYHHNYDFLFSKNVIKGVFSNSNVASSAISCRAGNATGKIVHNDIISVENSEFTHKNKVGVNLTGSNINVVIAESYNDFEMKERK